MIPKIIHQIWIGPLDPPMEWIDTWKKHHPAWQHILWNDKKIDELDLKNRKAYDYYYDKGIFNGSANVARYEILYRYGGLYVDADSTCLRSLDGAKFLKKDFFCCYSPNKVGRVSNTFLGSIKNHPFLADIIDGVSGLCEEDNLEPSWDTSGGTLLTRLIKYYPDIKPLSGRQFYGVDMQGKKIRGLGGRKYSVHHALTTHKNREQKKAKK